MIASIRLLEAVARLWEAAVQCSCGVYAANPACIRQGGAGPGGIRPWEDDDTYPTAFPRLLPDLQAEQRYGSTYGNVAQLERSTVDT